MRMGALRPLARQRSASEMDRDGEGRAARFGTPGDSGRAEASGRASARHDAAAFAGTREPSLVEVLNDPIVRSVMTRDGVPMDSLQGLLRRIGRGLS